MIYIFSKVFRGAASTKLLSKMTATIATKRTIRLPNDPKILNTY